MEEMTNTPEPQVAEMETKEKENETLYVKRDISECLGAAWTLVSTNTKRVCKTMAIPVMLYALAMSLYTHSVLNVTASSVLVATGGTAPELGAMDILEFIGGIILLIIAAFYFCGACLTLLNGKSVRHNIWRYIKQSLTILAIIFIAMTIGTGVSVGVMTVSETAGTLLLFLLTTACLFACVPLTYTGMKYFLEEDKKVSVIFKDYRKGVKHYWFILGTLLLTMIVVYVVSLIAQLPMAIALIAKVFSTMGESMGDPSGLPGSFGSIFLVTGFLSALVQGVTMIYIIFVQYYIYGSVEARRASQIKSEK